MPIQYNGTFNSCKNKHRITKTYLYNFDPLKPYFYIVKPGFTGVYIIFLISAQNIDCWYSLEPPRQGGSNEFPQSMFWAEIWKISEFFIWKLAFFGGKIFSIFVKACFCNGKWETRFHEGSTYDNIVVCMAAFSYYHVLAKTISADTKCGKANITYEIIGAWTTTDYNSMFQKISVRLCFRQVSSQL